MLEWPWLQSYGKMARDKGLGRRNKNTNPVRESEGEGRESEGEGRESEGEGRESEGEGRERGKGGSGGREERERGIGLRGEGVFIVTYSVLAVTPRCSSSCQTCPQHHQQSF